MMHLGNRWSQHSFAQVPQANMNRSSFNRSFAIKDTFNFDDLVPFFCDEMLPGDTINLNVKSFARLAPQVRPLMDNMYVDFFFFWVPSRIVWTNWVKMMGEQKNPGDSIDFITPTITAPVGGFLNGSIYDHLGIPTQVAGLQINALPLRAINMIRDEWFRDQNLQTSLVQNRGDGPDAPTDYALFKRAKKHDYFTSALPFLQKGSPVTMPLGTSAPFTGLVALNTASTAGHLYRNAASNSLTGVVNPVQTNGASVFIENGAAGAVIDPNGRWTASGLTDLSAAIGPSINLFRQAIQMQSFLERDARGGTRYVEVIRSHFNVTLPDFTAQRPEFLSGGTVFMNQHPVAQTSESDQTPQGNLAAFSTASETGNKIGCTKSFQEYGYVIGFMQARGEITYQQGLHRMWSRSGRFDYYWPEFQGLGEQPIYNREIYAQGTSADANVFGYTPRNDDYRFMPSSIRGQFRSNFAQTLDVWHLSEEFGSLPALNGTFIESNTPIERVLEVPDENYPDVLIDLWCDYKHARPMVTYAVPSSLGRF